VLVTWQPPPGNEWIREISGALAAGRDLPAPPPDAGPFSLSDPDRVRTLLTGTGFTDVEFEATTTGMWFGNDADDAHRFVLGLMGWMLEGLDHTGRARAIGAPRHDGRPRDDRRRAVRVGRLDHHDDPAVTIARHAPVGGAPRRPTALTVADHHHPDHADDHQTSIERSKMSLFAITREAGPNWTDGKGAFEQPEMNDHGAFMNGLADEGFLLFAGPLAGSELDRIRVLLIADAGSEADIHRRLADDPWARTQRVVTTNVEPWNLLVGADRLGPQPAAR
jgi:uncharacterized protein YciI